MRNMIVGTVLAILLVAGLFALAHYFRPSVGLQDPASVAAEVQPGFVGVKRMGPWLLVCRPAPKDAAPAKLGRCQVSLIYRRQKNPKQTVLVLTFRTQGPKQSLVAILVVPPIVKKGEEMDIQAGPKVLRLPVSVCKPTECAAAVELAPKGEADLLSAQNGALFFPPNASGKRTGVPVPFMGLTSAISAMRRAQS